MIAKALAVAILLFPVDVVSRAEEENPIHRVISYANKNPAPSPSITADSVSCMEEVLDVSPPTSPIPLFTKDDNIPVPLNVLAIACGAILSSAKSKTSPTLKPIIWEAEA